MGTQVLTGKLTFESLTPPDLSRCTRAEILEYFENSYDLNESLFTGLKDETVMYKCPDRLRLPLIFYYTHTAVVYVNKLILAGLLKERINFDYEKMFETGVDEMSWDDTENYRMGGWYQWPSMPEVVDYRRRVRQAIVKIISETPLQLPITTESQWWAVMMGIEHERIHLETSSVLIRQLPVEMLSRPTGWKYAPTTTAPPNNNRLIAVGPTDVVLGKPKDFPSYGWDNEYGEVACRVPPFEASEFLVSNAEFLEFIQDGGYNRKELWTEEGWKWRTFKEAKHPMFWVCQQQCKSGCGGDISSYSHCWFPASVQTSRDKQYMYRAMFDVLDMPWAWPVDVNYHEAKAYCTWKGNDYRLLVEAEHHVIRGHQSSPSIGVSSDIIFHKNTHFNHNMKFGSSSPVNMFPANELGFHDVFGNVWQWTEDQFNGLCSETHWLYDDFSSPCFDGKHNVILGGSWVSTGDEASRFARFAFRRHFLQHAGFRLARTIHDNESTIELPARIVETEVFVLGSGVTETEVYLDPAKVKPTFVPSTNIQYQFETVDAVKGILEQEFGFRKPFVVAVADLCLDLAKNNRLDTKSAMWIGSGGGRGPFTLSKLYKQVLAIDVVARFLDASISIQEGKAISFDDNNDETFQAALEPSCQPANVNFKQFTWIPNEVGRDYDLTVLTFLERTTQPKAWLLRLGEITRREGLVVIASPSGEWDRARLEPTLQDKGLVCAESQEVEYEDMGGAQVGVVSVWKHAEAVQQTS